MRWMWKNKYIVIAVIIVAILMGVMIKHTGVERQRFSKVEQVISTIFRPVENVLTDGTETVKNFFNGMTGFFNTHKENKVLEEKMQDYQALSHKLKEVEMENTELRQMADLQASNENFDLMVGEVINRSPSNWQGTFIINKGTKNGVEKDMTVISPQMELVGRVFSVGDSYAVVLPLIDQYSRVGGRIEETRETGVIRGMPSSTKIQCIMERLPRDAKVKKGQTVITSGLGIFPKGIIIGEVSSVKNGLQGISTEAMVMPYVNFNTLEKVFLIKRVLKEIPEISEMPSSEEMSESIGGQ